MTYREAYFSLIKLNNQYLNKTAIKTILIHVGCFSDFFELLNSFDKKIEKEKEYLNIIERVKKGEPIQYVLGYAFFVNSNYYVSPDVLIPRQETEQLAIGTLTYTKRIFKDEEKLNLIDMGTGSGVLAIYLKENFPNFNVSGVDISEKSLRIAEKNAEKHHVSVNFYRSDWTRDLVIDKNNKFDILVSNPPYILDETSVDKQVLEYEPHLALFAKPNTYFYEQIFMNVKRIMNDSYLLAFEIGEDMENDLSILVEKYLPGVLYKFEKDMYEKIRFLYIIKKGGK